MVPYAAALREEVVRRLDREGWPSPATVYLGGGTPSHLPPPVLHELVSSLPRRPGAEVTVECNPEDVDDELLDALRDAGVTRVSLGVQSLSRTVLEAIGRHGDPERTLEAVERVAQAGFPTYSVDLVYGSPAETDADLAGTLEALLALDCPPPHLSAYALTVEPGTPLSRAPSRHPDDDACAARYELVDEVLTRAGLEWYEVSNWALPGHECRHNLNYWAQGDYLGAGCGAHSHRGGHRSWNIRPLDRYLAAFASGRSPVAGGETLKERERVLEGLELALRTRAGVPEDALPADDPALEGLLEREAGRVRLTRRGRLLANEVSLRLRPDRPSRPTGAVPSSRDRTDHLAEHA
jgi:putative oxygen-independent coproporphyrinogen III oxidase